MNTLLTVVVGLIVIGLVLWGINQLPLDETIKKIIRVVVVIVVVLWLLSVFGLIHYSGINLR